MPAAATHGRGRKAVPVPSTGQPHVGHRVKPGTGRPTVRRPIPRDAEACAVALGPPATRAVPGTDLPGTHRTGHGAVGPGVPGGTDAACGPGVTQPVP